MMLIPNKLYQSLLLIVKHNFDQKDQTEGDETELQKTYGFTMLDCFKYSKNFYIRPNSVRNVKLFLEIVL